jgi:phosphatidylglycerophosphatase A
MLLKVKTRIALLIAEFFYCGRFPYAPGTMGSLGALLIWVPLLLYSHIIYIFIALLLIFIIGIWSSSYGIAYYQKPDPKQVVIDEVAGMGIAFLVISPTVGQIIAAFVLFRFFDIIKPWPISYVEKRCPLAWGIMLDDIVAGIFTMALLALYNFF